MIEDWASALSDPIGLRARGLLLAEGRLVLERILAGAAGGVGSIIAVLAAPAAAHALDLEARVGDRLVTRTPAEMESLTGFNFHRGVLALVRRPPETSVDDVIGDVMARRRDVAERATPVADGGARSADRGSWISTPGARIAERDCSGRAAVLVVAEHLVDVDNVGSCFRNARALGAACVLLDDRCPDPLYRKAIRTSLGAVLEVPWAQAPIRQILDRLRAAGVVTVGLTPDRDVATLRDEVSDGLDEGVPIALVVGNEGHGLSPEARGRCNHLARIPMAGDADSINVATALAVALYECQVRRR